MKLRSNCRKKTLTKEAFFIEIKSQMNLNFMDATGD